MTLRLQWAICGLAVLVGCSVVIAQPRSYSGHQVVAVRLDSDADVQRFMTMEAASDDFDLWSEGVGIGVVQVRVSPEQRVVLDASGLRYEVLAEDVQQLLSAERSGAGGFFEDFRTNDDYITFMNNLATQYPALATIVNFGTTVEGRPMWGLRITGPGTSKPGLLIHGCEHAREWLTPPVVAYLAEQLLVNYGTDAYTTLLVDSVDWYLLPVMNPDGYEYSWTTDRLWRKNRRGGYGVDLNRNWGHFWGGVGSSNAQSSELYHGPSPFSEPETTARRDFFLANPHVRGHVDLHTFGTLLMWPWGYTSALPAQNSVFQAVGSVMRSYAAMVNGLLYTMGPLFTTIYPASGVSVDWVHGVAGRWSFTFELRGNFFIVPASQIDPAIRENLPALQYFGAWLAACDPMGTTTSGDAYPDCDGDGVADVCEMPTMGIDDCDGDMIPDYCESDCNGNTAPDDCEIADGAPDCDGNGVPDECQPDSDQDGSIDVCDNCVFVSNISQSDADGDGKGDSCDACPFDFFDDSDGDGACNSVDGCPLNAGKLEPGVCGCDEADTDSDGDNFADCIDQCPFVDDAVYAPGCVGAIPAVSTWGLIVLALLLMVGAKVGTKAEQSMQLS